MLDLYTIYLLSFRCVEFVGFILPAFPEDFMTRLFILFFYFVAHTLGLPTMYMKMKHETLDTFIEIQDIKDIKEMQDKKEFETQETP